LFCFFDKRWKGKQSHDLPSKSSLTSVFNRFSSALICLSINRLVRVSGLYDPDLVSVVDELAQFPIMSVDVIYKVGTMVEWQVV
jgi:hypothetical protein